VTKQPTQYGGADWNVEHIPGRAPHGEFKISHKHSEVIFTVSVEQARRLANHLHFILKPRKVKKDVDWVALFVAAGVLIAVCLVLVAVLIMRGGV
jgi:hypothetical protein